MKSGARAGYIMVSLGAYLQSETETCGPTSCLAAKPDGSDYKIQNAGLPCAIWLMADPITCRKEDKISSAASTNEDFRGVEIAPPTWTTPCIPVELGRGSACGERLSLFPRSSPRLQPSPIAPRTPTSEESRTKLWRCHTYFSDEAKTRKALQRLPRGQW